MSLRSPAFRALVRHPPSPFRLCQRRWAQVHDVRFHATNAQERILSRYREKLDQKAKEEGLGDIDSLKDAYKDKIAELRKSAAVPGATTPLDAEVAPEATSSPFPAPPPPPSHATSAVVGQKPASTATQTPPGVKTLSSFLDVGKTLELPNREIEALWRLRHASSSQSLSFALPANVWSLLHANAMRYPQFILPLPREEQGAEIHFLQWTFPHSSAVTVLFTHLAEYKLRGEFTSPHTTVTFHLELAEPKGLVLGQGNVLEGRGVTVEEGKWLVMCLQKFYGLQGEKEERKRLLEQFSRGDGNFKVEDLLDEAERFG